MMHFHRFKLGEHIVLAPPRGQIVGFSVQLHPHTNKPVTYYNLITPHGPIDNVPEDQLHIYEKGMTIAPEPLPAGFADPMLPRGDIGFAEALGGLEPLGTEPSMHPALGDVDVQKAIEDIAGVTDEMRQEAESQEGVHWGAGVAVDAAGNVEDITGDTQAEAIAHSLGDGDADQSYRGEERRQEDRGLGAGGPGRGTRSGDRPLTEQTATPLLSL